MGVCNDLWVVDANAQYVGVGDLLQIFHPADLNSSLRSIFEMCCLSPLM